MKNYDKNREISNGVNLLKEEETETEIKPAKKKKMAKVFSYPLVFLAIAFVIFSSKIIVSEQNPDSWIYKIPIIGQIKHLAESADKQLKGEGRARINILLLGMGGKNHEGGYLTDTIMLASLEPSSKKVALLSIPRDLTIPMEGMGWRKINNVNAYAEAKTPGSGGVAISQALSDILETPVDYFIRLDFKGFVNVIDELGGIEVYVENTLEDPSYPIMGREEAEPYESRFEHLYIPAGWQKMDGELALKYVRSRYGYGAEGSDFARARRQQRVIEAAKNKFLSKNTLFRPTIITNIIDELHEHLSTNIKIWEAIKLWNMFKDVSGENITNKVLDNSSSGLLIDGRGEDGAYILTPRSGDFAEIQYLVNNIFSDAPVEAKTKVRVEKASLDIRNGTWVNGLASESALDLEKYGFNVVRISNSSQKDFQKSVIYDLTYGEKMESLFILKEKTGANVSFNLPQWLIDNIKEELADEKNPEQPDFILILGQDADKTSSGADNTEE